MRGKGGAEQAIKGFMVMRGPRGMTVIPMLQFQMGHGEDHVCKEETGCSCVIKPESVLKDVGAIKDHLLGEFTGNKPSARVVMVESLSGDSWNQDELEMVEGLLVRGSKRS